MHSLPLFLEEKWKWTDSDTWWRCGKERQTREYLFKNPREWERYPHAVGSGGGKTDERKWTEGGGGPIKSRGGIRYEVRKTRRRPIRNLLENELFAKAVLEF